MKEIHKKIKAALKKSQEEMKKYTNRNKKEVVEYKVEDKVLLSTKDLTWQIRNRETKKLTEKFVGSYKIILENVVELELPASMKIHPVVNVSRIAIYQKQIKGQKITPPLVEIDGEKEYEVENILNIRDVRGKLKYLVRWKRYMAEEDTQERLKNLENAMNLVEEFEKKIREEVIRRVEMRKEKRKERMLNPETEMFKRSELPEKYTTKILFG